MNIPELLETGGVKWKIGECGKGCLVAQYDGKAETGLLLGSGTGQIPASLGGKGVVWHWAALSASPPPLPPSARHLHAFAILPYQGRGVVEA